MSRLFVQGSEKPRLERDRSQMVSHRPRRGDPRSYLYLKGGCGSTFCVVDFALITAFLSVDSPQLQGPKFDQNHGSGPNGALYATIPRLVSRPPTLTGANGCEL